ncbi:N-acetyltransferase [Lentilactobacillus fungorum]|uniref:N-acetyltransferase n=2 Tax=Lentilactobacillus fungorum TaxID=2201250 RepID=A0ABQ3VYW7_9LACO|nr:N-acetyltransferase [Lentilactobacillus fungorum]
MPISYQPAKLSQLPEIMAIERSGFSSTEAATEAAMRDRIQLYPDTFITAVSDGQLAGYIVGPSFNQRYLTDDLFEHAQPNNPADPYQTVLSLVVAPTFQGQGIASQLLAELAKVAKHQHRQAITLTCLNQLVPFYERNGYVNEGISASNHAGEVWLNMVRPL